MGGVQMARLECKLGRLGLLVIFLGALAPSAHADWLFPDCDDDRTFGYYCRLSSVEVAGLELVTRYSHYTDSNISGDGEVTMEAELWRRVRLSSGAVGDWSNNFGAEGDPAAWQPTSLRARYQVTPVSLYEYAEKFQMSVVRSGRKYSGPEQVSTHKGWVSSLPSRFVSIDARAADATHRVGGIDVVIRGGAIMDSPLSASAASRVRITNIARALAAQKVRVRRLLYGDGKGKLILRVAVKPL